MSRTALLRLRTPTLPSFTVRRSVLTPRPFSSTARQFARKDAQGKDDMKIEPNEYSKSGSDTAAAGVEETAFSPDKTRPEEQHDHASKESEGGEVRIPLSILLGSPWSRELSDFHIVQTANVVSCSQIHSAQAQQIKRSANLEVSKKAEPKALRRSPGRDQAILSGRVGRGNHPRVEVLEAEKGIRKKALLLRPL